MALTGAASRLGTATELGASEASPRGCSEFRSNLYVLGARRLLLMSDLAAGSGEYVSGTLADSNGFGLPSIGALGSHENRLYLTAGRYLYVFDEPFRGESGTGNATVSSVGTISSPSEPVPKGLASDGTHLHVVTDGGRDNSGIYSIDTSDGSKTRVGTIAWPSGLTNPRPLGLFYYDGAFHVVERSEANLYRLSAPDANNSNAMTATLVRVGIFFNFDASESIPTGCGVFNERPYLVGSGNDAIYRFLDTPVVAATIPRYDVDEGADLTIDTTEIVEDFDALEFQSGYTAPSWLSVSGTDVIVTSAVAVDSDTDFTVDLRALNGSFDGDHTDFEVMVRVLNFVVPVVITVPSAPTSLSLTATHNTIVATWGAPTDNGGEAPTRYDIRIDGGNWVSTNLETTHTFTGLSPETSHTIDVAAVNSAGRGTAARRTRTTLAAPIVVTVPSAPTSLSLTATHNTIVATWAAPTNNGGEAPTRYDTRINNGNWVNAGLDGTHTFRNRTPETDYTIDVAAVNSAGRGATASRTQRTDAAPIVVTVPSAPTSLSLRATHNTIVATWAAPTNTGGENPTRYDIRIDGGNWVNAGLDGTHTFRNLTPERQWTIDVVAVNSAGRGATASRTQRTDAAPIVITAPGAPTSLSLRATHNSIVATWGAPTDTGNAVIERYDIRIDGGEWENVSLLTNHTYESLSPETRYTIEVAAVNSAGRGASARRTRTTPAAPVIVTVPGAPTSLSLRATHNSIVATWGAPTDTGNAVIERYDIRIDGGSWIDAGLDGTHTFRNLSQNTAHTIDVAGVNSAGRGATASGTKTTGITAPGAPTSLSVDLKPTTAVIRWAAADGAEVDEYEVSYAEGASPGTTWIATGSTGTRFFVKGLKRGTQYTFGMRGRNSAGAGDASRRVTERTPIASLHNALFFKECVNALDNGERVSEHGNASNIIRAAADNNYKTFSTVRDYDIDMSRNNQPTRVDAVFIKSKGITQHSGTPTGGSGTGWTNEALPETVENWEGTHISTTVLGFQHHLLLLDQHFTATSVRVRFEGTNVEIYEIMLLEFGISIDANGDFTEIATNFVDREGVIHSDPGGGIAYDSSIGDQRDKWEVDYVVKVVPNKTLLQTPEEFLYWRSENRNHVHAMEPSRFPWRVFPAVFVRKSVPVRYRTDDKLGGEILSFRVSEQ